ncbi:MAG: c-type cytochrome, partial [Alcanivoracaceae bacterium]|nr:c-type cytochrome [Alcanivoracaceae bacterium]
MKSIFVAVLLAVAGSATAPVFALDQDPDLQLSSGKSLYNANCSQCHAMSLRGSAHGTALRGAAFHERWGDRDSTALLRFNQVNMPPGSSGSLSENEHLAIVAYLLTNNNISLEQ